MEKRKLDCNFCKYSWLTKSKMIRPTCPSCRKAVWNTDVANDNLITYVDGVPQFRKNEVHISI